MNRIVISEINYKKRDFVVFIEMDENRKYQKFFIYPKDQKSLVGNVYIARVDKVVKGIDAAFVKIALKSLLNSSLSLGCGPNRILSTFLSRLSPFSK